MNTSWDIYDRFQVQIYLCRGGRGWGPKKSHFDRKLLFSTNAAFYLITKPQINNKTDLNTWNEEPVSCLTSYDKLLDPVLTQQGIYGAENSGLKIRILPQFYL